MPLRRIRHRSNGRRREFAVPVRPGLFPGLTKGPETFLKYGDVWTWIAFVVDVPFSLALDTVLLPFDLADRAAYDRRQEAEYAGWAEADQLFAAAPGQRGLADLAIADPRPKVRTVAIDRLTDPAQLARVAMTGQAWLERRTAVERLTDPAVLQALFDADVPAWVKGAARDRLLALEGAAAPTTRR